MGNILVTLAVHSLRCCCLLLLLTGLGAGEARVEWHAERSRARIGDELGFTLRYRWPRTATLVRCTTPAELLEGQLATEVSAARDYHDGEMEVREWELRLIANRSDSWILPVPAMVLRDAAGGERTVRGEQLIVSVDQGSTEGALPPASGLYMVPPEPDALWWPWWLGGAVVLLALAGMIAVTRFQRERPAMPPIEAFLRELERLREERDGRRAAADLSRATRRYCGDTFAFDGIGATTGELDRLLRRHLPDTRRLDGRRLLERLDALRWAPDSLRAAQVVVLGDAVREWVTDLERWLEERREAERQRAAEREAAA